MSWTYDLTTSIGQVRFLMGATVNDGMSVQDDEVTFCLTRNGSDIYRAAAFGCRRWAAALAQDLSVDQGTKGWKLDRQAQARQLLDLAKTLDADAVIYSGAVPFSGGISVSDKQSREQDTDRVAPQIGVATNRRPGLPQTDGTTEEPGSWAGWPW